MNSYLNVFTNKWKGTRLVYMSILTDKKAFSLRNIFIPWFSTNMFRLDLTDMHFYVKILCHKGQEKIRNNWH